MKFTTERELRESIQKEIKGLAKKAGVIKEEGEIDLNVDLSQVPGVPKALQKLSDKDISPQRFAALDQELDQSENVTQQAIALLVFALNYSDRDTKRAITLLKKAISLAPTLQKKIDAAQKKK